MKYPSVVKGDFGFTVRVNTGVALAGYSTVHLRFRKPGASTWVQKTGAVYSSTYIDYVVQEADNLTDTVGKMKVEARALGVTAQLTSAKPGIIHVVDEGDL